MVAHCGRECRKRSDVLGGCVKLLKIIEVAFGDGRGSAAE